MTLRHIALTGAAGQLGSVLRQALVARGISLRSAAGSHALQPIRDGEDVMHGDLREPAVVDRLLTGIDLLIHFAGTSVERPLPEIIDNNLRALVEVYEGARRHRVRRVVFASSNHSIGMYPVSERLGLDCAVRPDGFYGPSKVWGEALARMYWDKHGIESICVRIGSCLEKPTEPRHLSTWLGHADLLHFVDRCIAAPEVGFMVVWGVSAKGDPHADRLVDREDRRRRAQVRTAGETMGRVVAAAQQVSKTIESISRAATEQATGIAQVSQAVAAMDTDTQHNAALVEEATATTDSMTRQALALVGLLSRFKTAA